MADSSESSESSEEAPEAEIVPPSPVEVEPEKPKAKAKKSRAKVTKATENIDELDDLPDLKDLAGEFASFPDSAPAEAEMSAEPNALAMRRSDFSGEAERQRLFGRTVGKGRTGKGQEARIGRARGQTEGKTLHHRRLFLVELTKDEPWPKPHDTSQMVAHIEKDGAISFDFKETEASQRSLVTLQSIVSQEDPELLQQYLQRNPFSMEGLLVMAEYHRRQSSYDQARLLIRRAVYTLECNFAPEFSPFEDLAIGPQASRPRVRLRVPKISRDESGGSDWFGWSWLRALWMHMHCLAGQGMHRTSLEVCKLLLAATLPRDPLRSLLWADHLCLRSRQYTALQQLSTSLATTCGSPGGPGSLELAFPNFAYSVALAGILQKSPDMSALNHLTLEQILSTSLEELEGDSLTFARLMRALLYFPAAVRPLLDEAGTAH